MKGKSARGTWMSVAVIMVITPALLVALRLSAKTPKNQPEKLHQPRVSVKSQPGSPLLIGGIDTQFLNQHQPELHFTLINVGRKAISAYTIRHQLLSDQRIIGGGNDLSSKETLAVALQPGSSEPESLGEGEKVSGDITTVVLAVDFVEFVDGETWGPDLERSSESLAGYRAGARKAADYFRPLVHSKALPDLAQAAASEGSLGLKAPDNQSELWMKGFSRGIDFVKSRVQQAIQAGGLDSVDTALDRPIDARDQMVKRR